MKKLILFFMVACSVSFAQGTHKWVGDGYFTGNVYGLTSVQAPYGPVVAGTYNAVGGFTSTNLPTPSSGQYGFAWNTTTGAMNIWNGTSWISWQQMIGTTTVPNGGTGDTSLTQYGVLYGNGTSPVGITAAGTTGQFLGGNTGAAPTWQSVPTPSWGQTLGVNNSTSLASNWTNASSTIYVTNQGTAEPYITVAGAGGYGTGDMMRFGNALSADNANGTILAMNPGSSFTGDLADWQVNGTKEFLVGNSGAVTVPSLANAGYLSTNASGTLVSNAGVPITSESDPLSLHTAGGTMTGTITSTNNANYILYYSGARTGYGIYLNDTNASYTYPTLYINANANEAINATSNIASSGATINGTSNGSSGIGVLGYSSSGWGVSGQGLYGGTFQNTIAAGNTGIALEAFDQTTGTNTSQAISANRVSGATSSAPLVEITDNSSTDTGDLLLVRKYSTTPVFQIKNNGNVLLPLVTSADYLYTDSSGTITAGTGTPNLQRGTVTISASSSSQTFSFSFSAAPTSVVATPTSNPGFFWWVSGVTATGATINTASSVTGNVTFDWIAVK